MVFLWFSYGFPMFTRPDLPADVNGGSAWICSTSAAMNLSRQGQSGGADENWGIAMIIINI